MMWETYNEIMKVACHDTNQEQYDKLEKLLKKFMEEGN